MDVKSPVKRHLPLEGSYNIRELGGYATLDGKYTRWQRVWRSDSLHNLSLKSQKALINQGIKTIVDLRRDSEIKKHPNVLAKSPAVNYINIPMFFDEQEPNIFYAETLQKQYYVLLEDCQKQVKLIIEAIANSKPPILFHCAVGKDRTGLIAAFLLHLAKVPAATIAEDYALSADYLAPLFAPEIEIAKKQGYGHIYESPPQVMLDTLNYLDNNYGGVTEYLRKIGLTNEHLSQLRGMLVDR